jgi:hypothetical protein
VSADPVARLAHLLGGTIARDFGILLAGQAELSGWRAVRSTWGAARMTLTRSASALGLPGIPGDVVVDPDPMLATQPRLWQAAKAAIRVTLRPSDGTGAAQPPPARLTDDVGVLVLALEIRHRDRAWRLRACFPGHTLAAVLAASAQAAPPPATAPGLFPRPTRPPLSPQVEAVREIAQADANIVAALIRQLLQSDQDGRASR